MRAPISLGRGVSTIETPPLMQAVVGVTRRLVPVQALMSGMVSLLLAAHLL